MRYWAFTLGGLLIAGASVVAFDWGLYHVVRTGSCASGGAYVSARPCPPGTATYIVSLMAGVFGGLIGVGVYSARGPGGRASPLGLGVIMWSLLFITIAFSVGVAAYGPASDGGSGAHTIAIIFAAIFIPMGLAPLVLGRRGNRRQARMAQLVEQGKRCHGRVVTVEDTGVTINDNPRVKMTVRAEPPGEPPFDFVKTSTVSRVQIPRPGDPCTVFYDPADREGKNAITFDPVPGFSDTPAASAPPAAAVQVDGGDPLEKIAKLGQLRDRGLVTPEEFEQQKARLLKEI